MWMFIFLGFLNTISQENYTSAITAEQKTCEVVGSHKLQLESK